jgi:FecR protein
MHTMFSKRKISAAKLWSTMLMVVAAAVCMHAHAAQAPVGGDIVVASVTGKVEVSMHGAARKVANGTVVELPAVIRTGADGRIELRQGPTTVGINVASEVEFPATANRGDLIERILQTKGNALYKVGKRGANKLRVETPFLVAVVKGTEFNVATPGTGATISLLEGVLEIRASDDSDIVEIKAGQMAVKNAGDKRIRALRLDTGANLRQDDGGLLAQQGATAIDAGALTAMIDVGPNAKLPTMAPMAPMAAESPGEGALPDLTGTSLLVSTGLESSVTGAPAASGISGATSGSDASLGAGAAVTAGMGGAGVAAAVNTPSGIDLGAGSVNTGVSAGVGGIEVGAGAGANVATGGGNVAVNTGVTAGVAAGGTTVVGVGTSTGVNLGAGSVNTSTGVTVGGISTGVSVGLNPGNGLTVTVGNNGVGNASGSGSGSGNSGSNSGSGSGNSGPGNGNSGSGSANSGHGSGGVGGAVGGLVGGLLGGRGSLRH